MNQPVKSVSAIQVAQTKEWGENFEVVPRETNAGTHWSLYLRFDNGEAEHVVDFARNAGRAFDNACKAAVQLSIDHQVPIEPIP